MPDSYGKRHRNEVKARKAVARDARRVARTKRRAEGSSTEWDGDAWLGQPSSESDPGTASGAADLSTHIGTD